MTPRPSRYEFLTKNTFKKTRKEDSIRLKVLNGLLYKSLSELLCTPEVSQEVYDLNVELSKVSRGQGWRQGRASLVCLKPSHLRSCLGLQRC